MEFKFVQMKGHALFLKGVNNEIAKMQLDSVLRRIGQYISHVTAVTIC